MRTHTGIERQCADDLGISVEELRRGNGHVILPCECGKPDCEGWRAITGAKYVAEREREAPGGGCQHRGRGSEASSRELCAALEKQ